MTISKSELAAVEIALDELISYVDTVGNEGDLDDEEMPSGKFKWTIRILQQLVEREKSAH